MKEVYVAYLDILGFKELIRNNTIEHVENIYRNSFIEGFEVAADVNNLGLGFKNDEVTIRVTSDSIIIWTNSTSYQDFVRLSLLVQALLMSTFKNGIPFRGSISIGQIKDFEVTQLSNHNVKLPNIVLGEGLVNAYELETIANWAGCIIDWKAISAFTNQKLPKDAATFIQLQEEAKLILKYDVPMKIGTQEYYCLNWLPFTQERKDETSDDDIKRTVYEKFAMHRKSVYSEDVVNKITNTTLFLKHAKANPLPSI